MRSAVAARFLSAIVALALLVPAASFTTGGSQKGLVVGTAMADGTTGCSGSNARCVDTVEVPAVALLWVAGVLGLVGSATTQRAAWAAGALLLLAAAGAAATSPWWMAAPPFQAYAVAVILATAASAFVLAAALHPRRRGADGGAPSPFT